MGSGASGTYVFLQDLSGHTTEGLKGFVFLEGICERGPINTPTLCNDTGESRATYGWLLDSGVSDFAYLVKRCMQYGARVWINRIAHYTDPGDRTTLTATMGAAMLVDRAEAPQNTLVLTAINEGPWSAGIKWTVTDGTISPTTQFNLIIEHETDPYIKTETYQNATVATILEMVNGISKIVTIADDESPTEVPGNRPAVGTGNLSEGDDGLTDLNTADYIGDDAAETGFYAFDSVRFGRLMAAPECVTLADPGPAQVQAALQTYCNTHRMQMVFALHSPPMGLVPTDAADFRNGTGNWDHTPINDWCGAMFYGDLGVLNPRTGSGSVFINPLSDVAGRIAKSHADRGEHFAVSGPRRSMLVNVDSIRYEIGSPAKQGTRDVLAASQVNMIVSNTQGAYIDGFSTLQRESTQMQNMDTAWLFMAMKETLYEFGPSYCDEKINLVLFKKIAAELDPWLAGLVSREGIYDDYLLQCDQDATDILHCKLNKPQTIEQHEVWCGVAVKPTITGKWIGFIVQMTKLGATFTDIRDISELV
jgi:hypothetical protein